MDKSEQEEIHHEISLAKDKPIHNRYAFEGYMTDGKSHPRADIT